MRIRPHDSAESCGLCHPSPRNTYFQPKPGSVANCECGAAPGSHRPLVGGNARIAGGNVRSPPRTDQRSVPTGRRFCRWQPPAQDTVGEGAGRPLRDRWRHGPGALRPAGWAGRPIQVLPSVQDCTDGKAPDEHHGRDLACPGEGGLPPPGMWRTEALLCAVGWMPGRTRHYVQSHAGQNPALRAKPCRAEPGTTYKAIPGRARHYVQSDAGQSPALRAKRCRAEPGTTCKAMPGRAGRDQATPAPFACTSAWYEERTIGPEATWLKPSS